MHPRLRRAAQQVIREQVRRNGGEEEHVIGRNACNIV